MQAFNWLAFIAAALLPIHLHAEESWVSLGLEFPRGFAIEYRDGPSAWALYSISSSIHYDELGTPEKPYYHPAFSYDEDIYGLRYGYLHGEGNHVLEITFSAQVEMHHQEFAKNWGSRRGEEYGLAMGFGYRYEPVGGGAQFRLGMLYLRELNDVDLHENAGVAFEDLFESGTWPYMSVGWSF